MLFSANSFLSTKHIFAKSKTTKGPILPVWYDDEIDYNVKIGIHSETDSEEEEWVPSIPSTPHSEEEEWVPSIPPTSTPHSEEEEWVPFIPTTSGGESNGEDGDKSDSFYYWFLSISYGLLLCGLLHARKENLLGDGNGWPMPILSTWTFGAVLCVLIAGGNSGWTVHTWQAGIMIVVSIIWILLYIVWIIVHTCRYGFLNTSVGDIALIK